MHSLKLTHTDMKPENILFVNDDYEETTQLPSFIHKKLSIYGESFGPEGKDILKTTY